MRLYLLFLQVLVFLLIAHLELSLSTNYLVGQHFCSDFFHKIIRKNLNEFWKNLGEILKNVEIDSNQLRIANGFYSFHHSPPKASTHARTHTRTSLHSGMRWGLCGSASILQNECPCRSCAACLLDMAQNRQRLQWWPPLSTTASLHSISCLVFIAWWDLGPGSLSSDPIILEARHRPHVTETASIYMKMENT